MATPGACPHSSGPREAAARGTVCGRPRPGQPGTSAPESSQPQQAKSAPRRPRLLRCCTLPCASERWESIHAKSTCACRGPREPAPEPQRAGKMSGLSSLSGAPPPVKGGGGLSGRLHALLQHAALVFAGEALDGRFNSARARTCAGASGGGGGGGAALASLSGAPALTKPIATVRAAHVAGAALLRSRCRAWEEGHLRRLPVHVAVKHHCAFGACVPADARTAAPCRHGRR